MSAPTDPDSELRSLYPISAMRPAVQDEVIALVKLREKEARLDTLNKVEYMQETYSDDLHFEQAVSIKSIQYVRAELEQKLKESH